MSSIKTSFQGTGVVTGTQAKPKSFDYVVPYKDRDLKGQEILDQLAKWVKYGTIEPEAGQAIAEVVKNKVITVVSFFLTSVRNGSTSPTNISYFSEQALPWALSLFSFLLEPMLSPSI